MLSCISNTNNCHIVVFFHVFLPDTNNYMISSNFFLSNNDMFAHLYGLKGFYIILILYAHLYSLSHVLIFFFGWGDSASLVGEPVHQI